MSLLNCLCHNYRLLLDLLTRPWPVSVLGGTSPNVSAAQDIRPLVVRLSSRTRRASQEETESIIGGWQVWTTTPTTQRRDLVVPRSNGDAPKTCQTRGGPRTVFVQSSRTSVSSSWSAVTTHSWRWSRWGSLVLYMQDIEAKVPNFETIKLQLGRYKWLLCLLHYM